MNDFTQIFKHFILFKWFWTTIEDVEDYVNCADVRITK